MYRNSSYCTWNSHKWPNSEIFCPHYVADATVELTYLLGFTIMHFYEALSPETPHLPWNLPCSMSACAPPRSTKTNKTNKFSLSVWLNRPPGICPMARGVRLARMAPSRGPRYEYANQNTEMQVCWEVPHLHQNGLNKSKWAQSPYIRGLHSA